MINFLLNYFLSYYLNLLYYLFLSISLLKTSPNEIVKFLMYFFFDFFYFLFILFLTYLNFVFIYFYYYFSLQFIFNFIFKICVYYYIYYCFYSYYYSYFSDFFFAKYSKGKTSISEEIYIQNWFEFLVDDRILKFRRKGINILEEEDLDRFEDGKHGFLHKVRKDTMTKYFESIEHRRNRNKIMRLSQQQRHSLNHNTFLKAQRLERILKNDDSNTLIYFSKIFKRRSHFYRYGIYIYYLIRYKEALFEKKKAEKIQKKLEEKYGALYDNELKNKNDHKSANIVRIKTSTEIDFLDVEPIVNSKEKIEQKNDIINHNSNTIIQSDAQNHKINENLKKN